MDRNEYRRALIMLRSLKKGYAGHGRIEVRTLTGRLNVLVTAPEGTGLTQQVALVGRRRGEYYAWPLGSLRRDLRGQAGLSVTFDPRDLGGRTLEAYCLMAVAEISGDDCQLALVGNLGGSCEMDWAQVREAVCGLYAPELVTDLPESAEDAPTPAADVYKRQVQHRVGNLVAHLVGMALGYGFGSKEMSHVSRTPFEIFG